MANSMGMPGFQTKGIPVIILARPLAVSASLGCIICSVLLLKVVPIFATLFQGLGVELSLATKFLANKYARLSAPFFCGALAAPIVTEALVPAVPRRLMVATSVVAATSASVLLIILTQYLPLFERIWKLKPRG